MNALEHRLNFHNEYEDHHYVEVYLGECGPWAVVLLAAWPTSPGRFLSHSRLSAQAKRPRRPCDEVDAAVQMISNIALKKADTSCDELELSCRGAVFHHSRLCWPSLCPRGCFRGIEREKEGARKHTRLESPS